MITAPNGPASESNVDPQAIDPRFAPPLRLPGRPDQTLSPMNYIALTNHSRDPTLLGRDWGLTEEPIETIHKGGFELFGVEYTAVELIPFTTGDKVGPRPVLVARYDRARGARGLLEQVTVLEVLEGGRYRLLCVAEPRDRLSHDEASRAEFLAFRREYVRVLLGKRAMAERQVLALQERDRELKEFFDKKQARSRHKPAGAREASAQPIRQADVRKEQENKLGKALQADEKVVRCAESTTESKGNRAGGRPRSSSTRVQGAPKSGLGNALGGATGFTSNPDE